MAPLRVRKAAVELLQLRPSDLRIPGVAFRFLGGGGLSIPISSRQMPLILLHPCGAIFPGQRRKRQSKTDAREIIGKYSRICRAANSNAGTSPFDRKATEMWLAGTVSM